MGVRTGFLRLRQGFTLVELLAVIAIIGTLVGLLLPAVQAARESARQAQCSNQMKQLALAIHNYESSNRRFPAGGISNLQGQCWQSGGWYNTSGQVAGDADSLAPWTVVILPFLDDIARYSKYDMTKGFATTSQWSYPTTNQAVQFKVNPVFKCPADSVTPPTKPSNSYVGVAGGGIAGTHNVPMPWNSYNYYFFINGILYNNSFLPVSKITDGTSKTFLMGENRYFNSTWCAWDSAAIERAGGSGDCWAAAQYSATVNQPNSGGNRTITFGSYHPRGLFFALADASVRFISEEIDITTYRYLGRRDDGQANSVE